MLERGPFGGEVKSVFLEKKIAFPVAAVVAAAQFAVDCMTDAVGMLVVVGMVVVGGIVVVVAVHIVVQPVPVQSNEKVETKMTSSHW